MTAARTGRVPVFIWILKLYINTPGPQLVTLEYTTSYLGTRFCVCKQLNVNVLLRKENDLGAAGEDVFINSMTETCVSGSVTNSKQIVYFSVSFNNYIFVFISRHVQRLALVLYGMACSSYPLTYIQLRITTEKHWQVEKHNTKLLSFSTHFYLSFLYFCLTFAFNFCVQFTQFFVVKLFLLLFGVSYSVNFKF